MKLTYIFLVFSFFTLLTLLGCEGIGGAVVPMKLKDQINYPSSTDFHTFISADNLKYMVRVDTSTQDSIDFIYLTNDAGSTQNITTGELLLKRKPISKARVAKSDLLFSVYNRNIQQQVTGRIYLPNINSNQPLNLFKVDRYSNVEKLKIYIKDTLVENAVKGLITQFTNSISIDTARTLMDTASINYLNTVLKIASSDDPLVHKKFIDDAEYPEAEYNLILNTKHIFLSSFKKKKPKLNKKVFNQFALFYTLISPGLWSMDFMGKEVKVESVILTGTTTAEANLEANSTIIGTKQFNFQKEVTPTQYPIKFVVHFNLEEGKWKMNIPSTYSYLHRQLRRISHNPNQNWDKQTGTKGEKSYREMIRNEIISSHPEVKIDQQLIY
ncbi:MAG: hypothetical protein AB8H03_22930 [Saprospiraceae bacterium]